MQLGKAFTFITLIAAQANDVVATPIVNTCWISLKIDGKERYGNDGAETSGVNNKNSEKYNGKRNYKQRLYGEKHSYKHSSGVNSNSEMCNGGVWGSSDSQIHT
ncbi:hypothetical protein PspLS_06255 [Pyricularia sp. CBS 133598]|nr:hypothetical protein PspLS_06255 [Pyricularia sp. CBS 133598]